ncbi:riboflavin synthase [Malassezia sp. CBS 17886]|nr:riboflavin synthase [Malassezia sp. CBS 17886]
MFTGLIEHVATVLQVIPVDAESGSFAVKFGDVGPVLSDVHVGDSIAVNGACLTVTHFDTDGGWFKVDIAPETLRRTNLGTLKPGDHVNLERAMSVGARFGGHIVQGHVDTMAVLAHKAHNESAITLTLRLVYDPPKEDHAGVPAPATVTQYLIPKGFITLDGASLTLIDVSPGSGGALDGKPVADVPRRETVEFTVMLIPHTQEHISLTEKPTGSRINVEFDMVGKYVFRGLEYELDNAPGGACAMLQRLADRAAEAGDE